MNIKIQQYLRKLDNHFSLVEGIEDEELKSLLSKYLCVQVSGLLESFIKNKISDYAQNRVPKEVSRFISQKMKDITNLKCTKLYDVLDCFSNEWANEFKSYIEEHEQQKNALDSVVTNRHSIAHGQSCSISFTNMQQYYSDVKQVINKLETIIR